jgi:L-fuculose-phosphate aldolase
LIGPAAVAPYETPGTQAFAEPVAPFARGRNTILLANHGVVCWFEAVTHAEWQVEVLDTYLRTLVMAHQIGRRLRPIPAEKIEEILVLKSRVGLPDARLKRRPIATTLPNCAIESCKPLSNASLPNLGASREIRPLTLAPQSSRQGC